VRAGTIEQRRASHAEYMRAYNARHRAKIAAQAHKRYVKNRVKVLARQREQHFLRKYGLTLADRDKMIEEQDDRCLICSRKFATCFCTHIDHCHKTGAVRGVLCNTCNTKLGWLETYSERIAAYLGHVEVLA
jgi:hypothetical protein